MTKSICLSAGHGGAGLAFDPGVVNKGLTEATLTVKIAKRAGEIIKKHNVAFFYVPDNLTLQGTINWINNIASQIGICVDVHINSGGGTGVEGWNYQGGPNESDKLSKFLADACAAETGLKNRGVKDEATNRHGRLGFIHDTKPVAALVECGFIDGDYDFLNTSVGIERMARGVARGCLGYIGVEWRPELLKETQQPAQPAIVSSENLAKAAQEARPYIFGYKTKGTVTERMAKVIEIFRKHGINN